MIDIAVWIYDRPHHWKCSECSAMWTDTAKDFFRYCPTCGAKMENVTYVDGKHFDRRNSCTGCPMFSNENGIRKCGNAEISGFIAKPDQNPIPNWCPLGSKNNEQ